MEMSQRAESLPRALRPRLIESFCGRRGALVSVF